MARCMVLTGFGINCERESLDALLLAGAEDAEIVHVAQLLSGDRRITDYQFIVFAGGFLDGDDLGSAKVQVNRFRHARITGSKDRLIDGLLAFVDKGGIALGICNGFQFMAKLGMLPGMRDAGGFVQTATLSFNDSGHFEDRWCYLAVDPDSPCIFTKGIGPGIYLPVRHGEGKFICDDATRATIDSARLATVRYSDATFKPTMEYPANPNGSPDAVAGVCDPTGRLFGLMPHPEAHVYQTHHPRWTRGESPAEPDGLKLFKNAIDYMR